MNKQSLNEQSEVNIKIELYDRNINPKDFSEDELKLIDTVSLSRHYGKISYKNSTEVEFNKFVQNIVKFSNTLPMLYMKTVKDSFQYVSQKSQMFGKNKDIELAALLLEPLNNDISDKIEKIPISQKLPLHSVVTLDISNPYESSSHERNEEVDYKFIWSNNLIIENPMENWIIKKCHISSLDIGSRIRGTWKIEETDPSITSAYQLFGFNFNIDNRELVIWIYKVYNLTIKELLSKMKDHGSNSANEILKSFKE
jgi:hypothetical protein